MLGHLLVRNQRERLGHLPAMSWLKDANHSLSDSDSVSASSTPPMPGKRAAASEMEEEEIAFTMIRSNLPVSALVSTPFGKKRIVYADYTASGRSLTCIETYITSVVHPLFANTHTENSATGLQTNAFREEAREIIMASINASPREDFALIFTGSGTTAAIARLIGILGLKLPTQLLLQSAPVKQRPLVLISAQEHHSNELLWRETNTCDVRVVPVLDSVGTMDLGALEEMLKCAKLEEGRELVIGSFSAGSNVTGICNAAAPIARIMHKYGGYACFDYAAAGPYVAMDMQASGMDCIFLSPHKFVGGPGTPGVLCLRKSFLNCTGANKLAPSVPGGGTVTLVWGGLDDVPPGVLYDDNASAREESGTPGILEAIRCGLVFSIRNQVGIANIEKREGQFAQRAVQRFQRHGAILLIGEQYSEMQSMNRLSITSFNIKCVLDGAALESGGGRHLLLNHHFVSTLLNDLYGIQSRSGCSCAGPYAFRLFGMGEAEILEIKRLVERGIRGVNLGWTRVNFNYFIEEDEFDFICSAVEQIATHGWKLLPLYSVSLKTGLWTFTGGARFNRHAGLRSLRELDLCNKTKVLSWDQGLASFASILDDAMRMYDEAPGWIRANLAQVQDFSDDAHLLFPDAACEHMRRFALPSQVLLSMGIPSADYVAARGGSCAALD